MTGVGDRPRNFEDLVTWVDKRLTALERQQVRPRVAPVDSGGPPRMGPFPKNYPPEEPDGWIITEGATAEGGGGAIAMGEGTAADGYSSFAWGWLAIAAGDYALSLGRQALAEGSASIAISATVRGSRAVGVGGETAGDDAVAIGPNSRSMGQDAISLGSGTRAKSSDTLAAGADSMALNQKATGVGADAKAIAPMSTAVGARKVIRRERAEVSAVDLVVQRDPTGPAFDGMSSTPVYPDNDETGIILTDADGVPWRITVDTSGNAVVSPTAIPTFGWTTAIAPAGITLWAGLGCSEDGSIVAAGPQSGFSGTRYIQTSLNGGVSWTTRTAPGQHDWLAVAVSDDGSRIAALNSDLEVWVSGTSGSSWSSQTLPISCFSMAASADLSVIYVIGNQGGMVSTDFGSSWDPMTLPTIPGLWFTIACNEDGSIVYAQGTGPSTEDAKYPFYYDAIYASSDSGASWDMMWEADSYLGPVSCSRDGNHVIVSTSLYGDLYHYRFGPVPGANFTTINEVGSHEWRAASFSADGTKIIAPIASGGGLFLYEDGFGWSYVDGSGDDEYGYNVATISADGTAIFAGGAAVYRN
jgi:hypothetical protein